MPLTFKQLIEHDASREQIEDWCRGKAQSYLVPFEDGASAVACRVLGKYIMYCAALDSALTPHLALNGIWEPWITMAIARHVQPGMRCMDIGACYGYNTRSLWRISWGATATCRRGNLSGETRSR